MNFRPVLHSFAVGCAVLAVTVTPVLSQAQATPASQNQVYRSDSYGISFQYPAGWVLNDQADIHTLTLSSATDAQALQAGKSPASLVISLAFTSLRELNVASVDDFKPHLLKLFGITTDAQAAQAQQTGRAVSHQTTIGGVMGQALDIFDPNGGVGGESAMLSIGGRRVLIARGLATADVWHNQGGQNLFTAILSTMAFFPPVNTITADQIGQVIWQTVDPRFSGFADLDAQTGGSTLLASDPKQGLWTLDSNGNVTASTTFPAIASYGSIVIYQDGTRFVADPINRTIWLIAAGGTPKKFISGAAGGNRGQFGSDAPRTFAIGYLGTFSVLDTNDQGTRIEVFDRGGGLASVFPLGMTVQSGAISSDPLNRLYVVGANLNGVWQLSANGQTIAKDLGSVVLTGAQPTASIADRFGNLYVATADEGIVKLNMNNNAKFEGVIGQAYDGATTPKPGQLAHPTALTLSPDNLTLYVGDSGKYPQVVAFSLQNTPALDLKTGSQDMGVIAIGQTINGMLTALKFANAYQFTGKKGDVVTITLKAMPASAGTSNTLDPYLQLIGTDGSIVAANDDASASAALGPHDAQITAFTLPADGKYTIVATRLGRESGVTVGAYVLTVSQ